MRILRHWRSAVVAKCASTPLKDTYSDGQSDAKYLHAEYLSTCHRVKEIDAMNYRPASEASLTVPSGRGTEIGATSTRARPLLRLIPIFLAVTGERSTILPLT
jgi:hypothetical protein